MTRAALLAALALVAAAPLARDAALAGARQDAPAAQAPMRGAYFYDYMDLDHLDSLASAGFTRGILHLLGDSLDQAQRPRLRAWLAHADTLGLELVPKWLIENPSRLASRPAERRYVWGLHGRVEPEIPCPVDSLYWRSALLDRAREILAAAPATRRVALDLELYQGSRKFYDAGPCRCHACLREYMPGATDPRPADTWRWSGLFSYQESRLAGILAGLLGELAALRPDLEVGVLDLDLDSFVHRALGRALASAAIPAADYCERSYRVAGGPLPGARARLDALGLAGAPLYGGLHLKGFTPRDLGPAVQSVVERADGYWVFTTYSLWLDPAQLTGPYALLGPAADYWQAFREVHSSP